MKCYLVSLSASLVLLLASTAVHALTPVHLWSQHSGGSGNETGYSVAVDESGNVYVTGAFTGTVDLGGGNLVSAGSEDIFLAKYDAAGVHQWSLRFGGTGSDRGNCVSVDASGNVCVAGQFSNTVDFGGGNLVSVGSWDVFLATYSPDGAHQWSQRFGSTQIDIAYAVASDESGEVCMAGEFLGTVNFGGGNLAVPGMGIFLARYDTDGTHLWSRAFGDGSTSRGNSVGIDGAGNVYLSGQFSGIADFGGGNLVSAGARDIVIASYDSDGVHRWSQRFGNLLDDVGVSLAVDGLGHVNMTGLFTGTVDFGGGSLVGLGSSMTIYLASFDTGGTHRWSQHFGAAVGLGLGVAADEFGNVSVTGEFSGPADFGDGSVAGGFRDVFLAKFDIDGNHLWSRHFGNTGIDIGYSVAAGGSGHVYATGTFQGTVNFGGEDLVSGGGGDMFFTKYSGAFAEPAITLVTDIGNDQGRKVKIRFSRSGMDDAVVPGPVTHYTAFRRDDAPPAMNAVHPQVRNPLEDGWTQVGLVNAYANDTYGIDVPTIGDSTIVLGQYHSAFFIRAGTAVPAIYFDSPIDSGYSVDNLAPGIPGSLLYNSGLLSWNESPAEDFDYFTVYGASADDFGSATVVDYTVSPDMDVTAAGYVYYFVTATDFSGNEGAPVKVNTLSGVGGSPHSYVLSVSSFPNPFNPRTTVSYTVPSRGAVSVTIYDARGARVATLLDNEVRDAGAYRLEWDGRADSGRAVSSGVYFARVHHNDAVRSKKLVLLK